MTHGFWVVESVLAASGDPKKYAKGWCQGVLSAQVLAEHLSEQENADFIVVDSKGQVV